MFSKNHSHVSRLNRSEYSFHKLIEQPTLGRWLNLNRIEDLNRLKDLDQVDNSKLPDLNQDHCSKTDLSNKMQGQDLNHKLQDQDLNSQ